MQANNMAAVRNLRLMAWVIVAMKVKSFMETSEMRLQILCVALFIR
jgi:hypothetical protein